MARTFGLNASPWSHETLDNLAMKAAEWGYQALELEVPGPHVPSGLGSAAPLPVLAEHEIQLNSLSVHALGQVIGDDPGPRHQSILPDELWGDGSPERVQERARDALLKVIQAAGDLGVKLLVGFTGSPFGHALFEYPPATREWMKAAWTKLGQRWHGVLDACHDHNVRFALHLHPSQAAFDLYSAETLLDAMGGRDAFGFALDPATLHWQGVDPVEFVRRFPDRIFQVRLNDAAVTLNGRTGILGSLLPPGDPRRGWEYRTPGRGGVDWEALMRALHAIRYAGPLLVDCRDDGMERDNAAIEARAFATRLDFEPAGLRLDAAFE